MSQEPDMDRYHRLLRKTEEARLIAAKKAGQEEQVMKDLKTKHGIEDIEEGKKLLFKIKTAREKAERKFKAKLDDFTKEFGEELQ